MMSAAVASGLKNYFKFDVEYLAPNGYIKLIELLLGSGFCGYVTPECVQGDCYSPADVALHAFLVFAGVSGLLCSSVFLVVHLWQLHKLLGERRVKFAEALSTLCVTALYFAARYYAATYYGGVERLRGRWIVITVLAWTVVVLYIIESLVLLAMPACSKYSLERNRLQVYQETQARLHTRAVAAIKLFDASNQASPLK